MYKGPGFLGIGAQKSGTTWLWKVLREHPQVWLPPIKELHWFDAKYPPAQLRQDELYRHREGISRYSPLVRNIIEGRGRAADVSWLWHFYHNGETDQNYLALFTRTDGRMPGEITPAYAILDEATVRRIHALVSADCNILFIMREPVARLWSAVRMYCVQQGIDPSTLSIAQFDLIAESPGQQLRTDYRITLDRWSLFNERLGLFFYEDLVDDPSEFLSQIFRFLGLDALPFSPRLDKGINVGKKFKLPPQLAARWRERYHPVVEAVANKVGRLPVAWTRCT